MFIVALAACILLLIGCGGSDGPSPRPSPTVTPNPPTPTPTPAFTSTPPTDAAEGELYTYEVAAEYPSNVVTFSLQDGPDNAVLEGDTLTWTPTHAQSRQPNAFVIRATGSEGGANTQSFSISPAGTVDVTTIDQHVVNRELVDVAPGSAMDLVVLVPQPDGAFAPIMPVSNSPGHVSFPRVPAGHYWLAATLGNRGATVSILDLTSPYRRVWTSASDVDLGRTILGRPDIVYGDNITEYFDLTFASPQTPPMSVEFYCPNVREIESLHENEDHLWTPMLPWSLPLIDASKGDETFIVSFQSSFEMERLSGRISGILGPIALTRVEGGSTTITGTVQPVALESTVHPVIKAREFEDMVASVIPGADMTASLTIVDVPYDGSAGPASGVSLLQSTIGWTAGPDYDMGEIPFSNPFPEHSEFTRFYLSGIVDRGQGIIVRSIIGPGVVFDVGISTLPTVEAPIAPEIGLVTSPAVDGKDMMQPDQTMSLTPTIAWEAPTLGTPTYYEVSILELESMPGGGYMGWLLPTFLTKETLLTVPEGILAPGQAHIIRVKAVYEPGRNMEQAPFKGVTETYSATVISPLFTTEGTPDPSASQNKQRIRIPLQPE